MEKNMEHIDNVFREGLGSYTEAPPSFVWDDLEKRLEDDRRKRAFSFRWRWYFTALSMVAIVSGSLAWKMAGHPAATEEAMPVENSTPIAVAAAPAPVAAPAATTPVAAHTNATPAKAHTAHKRPSHKAPVKHEAITAPVKEEQHLATTTKPHTATTQAIAKTEKPANNDYDMYEAATSGNDAELAKEPTKAEGYVVNSRTRHNIKVADMSPVEEKVARRPEPMEEMTVSSEHMVVSTMPAATATHRVPKHVAVSKADAPAPVAHTATKTVNTDAGTATIKKATVKHTEAPVTKAVAKEEAPVKTVTAPTHTDVATIATKVEAPVKTVAASKHTDVATTTKAIAKAERPVATAALATVSNTVKHTEAVKTEPTTAKKVEQMPLAAAPVTSAKATAAPATTANADVTTKGVKAEAPAKATVPAPAAAKAKTSQAEKYQPSAKAENTPAAAASAKSTAGTPVVHKVTTPAEQAAKAAVPSVVKKDIRATAPRHPEAVKRIAEAKQKPLAAATRTSATHEVVAMPAEPVAATNAEQAPNAETGKPVAGIIPSAAVSGVAKTTAIAAKEKRGSRKAATVALPTKEVVSMPVVDEPVTTNSTVAAKAPSANTTRAAKMAPAAKPVVTAPPVAAAPAKASQPAVVASTTTADHRLRPHFSYQAPESITEDYFLAAAKQQQEEAPIPGTFKDEVTRKADAGVAPAAGSATAAPVNEQPKQAAAWRKAMTGGIKVGAEATYTSEGARRAVVSPFLEYQMTPKMSILLQPAFKLSNVSKKELAGTQMWYNVHDDGVANYKNTDTIYVTAGTIILDTMFQRNYTYTQSHDSMVKSYNVGGTYFDIDLPIMFKYNLGKKFGVYGGVNFSYAKVGINSSTFKSSPIVVKADSFTIDNSNNTPAPPVSSVIRYGNTALSEPTDLYTSPAAQFRFGYVFGFSYEFRRRCLFDALIQQNFANANVIGGYNVNTALGLPYIRLSLGYRLMK